MTELCAKCRYLDAVRSRNLLDFELARLGEVLRLEHGDSLAQIVVDELEARVLDVATARIHGGGLHDEAAPSAA